MGKIIEFKNTNFGYNNVKTFNDFNMEIEEGVIASMIGTSGSGKTTLLKMLCHKLPNDTCYYMGKNFQESDVDKLKREVVIVFDSPIISESVRGEIVRYLKQIGIKGEEINDKYMKLREYFGLDRIENISTSELTWSDKYLVKILRYLIIEPKFLAIDSILTNLSKENKEKVFGFIKEKKITFLNVTNDIDEVLYGSKLYVLDAFVLILEGSTSISFKNRYTT